MEFACCTYVWVFNRYFYFFLLSKSMISLMYPFSCPMSAVDPQPPNIPSYWLQSSNIAKETFSMIHKVYIYESLYSPVFKSFPFFKCSCTSENSFSSSSTTRDAGRQICCKADYSDCCNEVHHFNSYRKSWVL